MKTYVMPTDEPVTHLPEMPWADARDVYVAMLNSAACLVDADSPEARDIVATFGPHVSVAEARAWHLRELDCDRKTAALAFAREHGERMEVTR